LLLPAFFIDVSISNTPVDAMIETNTQISLRRVINPALFLFLMVGLG
jgi:hypothetical protein